MEAPQVKSCYTEDDFETLGFHDCYVYGIRWSITKFCLILELDYIVQWIENDGRYQFWIAPAEMCFKNVADTKIELDWAGLAPECQIQDVEKLEFRSTPNGNIEHHWAIELSEPVGSIDLWATGFDLKILGAPRLSNVQHLSGSEAM